VCCPKLITPCEGSSLNEDDKTKNSLQLDACTHLFLGRR
jgi:hypothetical protein